jgi:hypothetical protein
VPDQGGIAAMSDDPDPDALPPPATGACRSPGGSDFGRWRCRVGWHDDLRVADAVIAVFGGGAG